MTTADLKILDKLWGCAHSGYVLAQMVTDKRSGGSPSRAATETIRLWRECLKDAREVIDAAKGSI